MWNEKGRELCRIMRFSVHVNNYVCIFIAEENSCLHVEFELELLSKIINFSNYIFKINYSTIYGAFLRKEVRTVFLFQLFHQRKVEQIYKMKFNHRCTKMQYDDKRH